MNHFRSVCSREWTEFFFYADTRESHEDKECSNLCESMTKNAIMTWSMPKNELTQRCGFKVSKIQNFLKPF